MSSHELRQRFQRGWIFTDLPGYRDYPKRFLTYARFDFDQLPPIPKDLVGYSWLLGEEPKERSLLEGMYPDGSKPDLTKLAQLQAATPPKFPPALEELISSPALQARLRSNTDCYLDLGDFVQQLPGPEPAFLLHFLSDSQWILHWYIFLTAHGDHCVLVSDQGYCFRPVDPERPELDPGGYLLELAVDTGSVLYCADDLTQFMYRFWMENEIWYSLAAEPKPLAPEQKAYLDHYRALKGAT